MKMKVFNWSLTQAKLFGLLGLLLGVLYAFGGLLIDVMAEYHWLETEETQGLSWGTLLAFLALLGMPFLGAMVGLLVGFLQALLYNLMSGLGLGFSLSEAYRSEEG